jgi:hypothetical protein
LVPDCLTSTLFGPLAGQGGLPIAGRRDEKNDSRRRLVQQPRQAGPLDDVALCSDEFGGRFADGASPEAEPKSAAARLAWLAAGDQAS